MWVLSYTLVSCSSGHGTPQWGIVSISGAFSCSFYCFYVRQFFVLFLSVDLSVLTAPSMWLFSLGGTCCRHLRNMSFFRLYLFFLRNILASTSLLTSLSSFQWCLCLLPECSVISECKNFEVFYYSVHWFSSSLSSRLICLVMYKALHKCLSIFASNNKQLGHWFFDMWGKSYKYGESQIDTWSYLISTQLKRLIAPCECTDR